MRGCREILWGLILGLFVFIPLEKVRAEEACNGALAKVEGASMKAQTDFTPSGGLTRSPVVKGRTLHITSSIQFPYLWITDPTTNRYAVAVKGDTGFGFSGASVANFNLLDGDGISLRSLDFVGQSSPLLLASFIVKGTANAKESLVLKLAHIKDSETGELELVDLPGLSIEGVKNARNKFVVSHRLNSTEFWISDGSRNLRIVSLDKTGSLKLQNKISLPQNIQIDGQAVRIAEILKVEFFDDGIGGYIKFRLVGGRRLIAPMSVVVENAIPEEAVAESSDVSSDQLESTPEPNSENTVEPQLKLHYSFDFDQAVEIGKSSTRTSVMGEKNLVFVSYPNHLSAYLLGLDGSFYKVRDMDTSSISEGMKVLGAEFYEIAKERLVQDQKGQVSRQLYDPRTSMVLLLKGQNDNIHLAWMESGRAKWTASVPVK